MIKKMILFTLLSSCLTSTGKGYEDSIFIDEGISFDCQPVCPKPCQEYPGVSYYNSRSIACYTTGLVIGVAVIAGMVAIVINQSHCSHSSH